MAKQLIEVGKISGVFGVKGWVKIHSYTRPRENILNYSPWQLSRGEEVKEIKVIEGRQQGKTLVATLPAFLNALAKNKLLTSSL